MINFDNVKNEPLTTNRIEVTVDMEKFFSMYSIVSYYSLHKDYKNLAYEQLANEEFLSVTGIRTIWNGLLYPATKFFILVEKGQDNCIYDSFRKYEHIRSKKDDLSEYDEKLQKRILASLAINSLGKTKKGKMMYNDGSLLICDNMNFLIPKSRKELVCLKIEVNEYLNLTSKTTSFSNPKDIKELRKYSNCVFQVGNDINGHLWFGLTLKPVVVRGKEDADLKLDKLYINKKKFRNTHNIVNYWPYKPEDYTHGKLYATSQVVESVNEKYEGILSIEFKDYNVLRFEQFKSEKDMLSLIQNYFNGRSISFEDPFGVDASKDLVSRMRKEFAGIVDSIQFPKKRVQEDMLIKLVKPMDEDSTDNYTKSLSRFAHNGTALQHKIFYNNKKDDKFIEAEARRLLIELLVKDCLIKRLMPTTLTSKIQNWQFTRYKINWGSVIGATISVDNDNHITISDFGFSRTDEQYGFEDFVRKELHYDDAQKINGVCDYMALKKDDNVYLIIDTDEIPILDVSLIDEGYAKVVEKIVPLSFFKRKDEVHKYLRGYVGFHLWRTEGLDGDPDDSFSYIVGKNNDNIQITKDNKMDRMPRARRLFVLHREHPELVEDHINEIVEMLKFGFGRWNEMMTYPFPFKFLQE